MNIVQDFIQNDQVLAVVAPPVLGIQEIPVRPTSNKLDQEPTPTPSSQELTESEAREPLKELCENDKGEETDQATAQEGENNEGGEKINDYVMKVLEKLVKQRSRVSKLNALLEKKGLLPEKKISQIQNLVNELDETSYEKEDNSKEVEDDENSIKGPSKENLSPKKVKQLGGKLDVLAQRNESPNTLQLRALAKYSLEDVLQVSRRNISYGTCFPGQVVEEHLDIVNKSGLDFVVQIVVSCLNEELQNTEEYVYSVRRSHLYDYNDKHYLIMAPRSCASFKFALKVPNLKLNGNINGQIHISIQGMSGSYILDLITKVSIPRVFCPKELHFNGLSYNIIKLAVKEGKKQDMKIPFKNNGDVPVTLELEFYEPKERHEKGERAMFDCLVHPNVITINPNSSTLTTIMVKPWKVMLPIKGVEKAKGTRRILTGRVRDTAVVYSFVFWIEIY